MPWNKYKDSKQTIVTFSLILVKQAWKPMSSKTKKNPVLLTDWIRQSDSSLTEPQVIIFIMFNSKPQSLNSRVDLGQNKFLLIVNFWQHETNEPWSSLMSSVRYVFFYCNDDKYSPFVPQSQEALLEHCRQAGITFMVLVSDKEGNYLKVNHINTCAEDTKECSDLTGSLLFPSGEVLWERPSVGEENPRVGPGRSLHPKEPDQTLWREEQVTYTDIYNRKPCVRVQRKHLMLFFLSSERFLRVPLSRIQRDHYWETQVRVFQAGSRSTFLSYNSFSFGF